MLNTKEIQELIILGLGWDGKKEYTRENLAGIISVYEMLFFPPL